MNKLLTISIAAYNVEMYIEKLLDSIIDSGKLDEIEVLVVNDGSKDKTVEITNKYVKRYPNSIYLINKPNGGHGSTINTGIKNAHGKYFKAIDGDDWIDSTNLAKLIENMKKTNSDLILCNHKFVFEKNGSEEEKKFKISANKEMLFD